MSIQLNKDGRPNARQLQAEARRRQILDTALSVFAQKGFANTSIKDLAAAAGISSGLMYHYFPSKARLLEAAAEHHSFLPQLRATLRDIKEQPCREVLRHITLEFLDLLEQNKPIVNIFLQEGRYNAQVQRIWAGLANGGVDLLKDYITARIAAGEMRPHDAEITARCLFSSVITFQFTLGLFKTSRVTRAQYVDGMVEALLHGIMNNAA